MIDGQQITIRFDNSSDGTYYETTRSVQAGYVFFEDTADEDPDRFHQRFNVGLDVTADRFIPEPATLALLALGGVALIRRRC